VLQKETEKTESGNGHRPPLSPFASVQFLLQKRLCKPPDNTREPAGPSWRTPRPSRHELFPVEVIVENWFAAAAAVHHICPAVALAKVDDKSRRDIQSAMHGAWPLLIFCPLRVKDRTDPFTAAKLKQPKKVRPDWEISRGFWESYS
jgi:hypothetical protein